MALDPRRTFTDAQRQAIWLAASGVCEQCGTELGRGWHADHITPHSRGGRTDITNAAALCASCNLRKGATVEDPRNIWQDSAVDSFIRGTQDFLVTACPGAGKTLMALKAAKRLFDVGQIDRVIVVVPTNPVRAQWSKAAAGLGLDLTANYQNGHGAIPRDAHGVVATYAQVAYNRDVWSVLCSQNGRRSLVILDEVHHCQEHDNSTWGPALTVAFGGATRRLMLSGTPFRTDGQRIPFVRYDSQGIAISDGGMDYRSAVAGGVVRPVRFEVMDGRGEWLRGSLRSSAVASSVAEEDRPGLMKSLYKPGGLWMSTMLSAADRELTRIREEMPNAGALVVSPGINEAVEYAAMLERITGQPVHVVHSDREDNDATIAAFRAGADRWIVAVDMISEGVDIPRLSTLVFASTKMTEMWFRQVVGRVVRRDGDELTATVFIPAFRDLVAMAENIECEAEAGLADAVDEMTRRADGQTTLDFEVRVIEPISSSEATLDRVLVPGGDIITDTELERALRIQSRVGGSLRTTHLADIALALREASLAPLKTVSVTVPRPSGTVDDLRAALKRQVNNLANRYAKDTGTPHSHVHAELNGICGDTLPTATVASLEKRVGVLHGWL